MKYIVLLTILVFALSGCVLPPATAAVVPAPEKAAEQSVPDQEVPEPVEASDTETTTVEVLVEVPTDRVLSVAELWPSWAEGSGDFTVPEGYTAWVTTDPGDLFLRGERVSFASFAVRSVLILSEGEYTLDTYHSIAGNINAWMESTPSQYFTMLAPNEQALRMHDLEGNPAPIVDLRVQINQAAPSEPEVTIVVTTTEVVEEVDVPSTQTEVEVKVVPEMACVPEYESFVRGYSDESAQAVQLIPAEGNWVIAGHDPASVNGQQTVDKAVTIVAPGAEATITGLGRDAATGRAFIYACQMSLEPSDDFVQQWVARESANGRQVEIVRVD